MSALFQVQAYRHGKWEAHIMKRVFAVNGSPRRNRNTAALLDAALQGMQEACTEEIQAKRIDLYSLTYTGCRSCFACKLIDGKSYGKCALKDDLAPVMEEILQADALVFGSPVYYRNITGQMHAFYERLLFPYTVYSRTRRDVQAKKIPTAFLYTMNVKEDEYLRDHYDQYLGLWEKFIGRTFGVVPLSLCAFDTYQFDDYAKYVSDYFNEAEKRSYREAHFAEDLARAEEAGRQLMKKD